jgi:mannose-1-phosphate guanylyltransferase
VGPQTVFVALHADLAVGYPDELRRLLKRAAGLAASDTSIVALGAEPTRPETGFGYLVPGPALEGDVAGGVGDRRASPFRVEHFVEKPGAILAQELIDAGAFWHTGIVVAQAGTVLDALAEHTTGAAAGALGARRRQDGPLRGADPERVGRARPARAERRRRRAAGRFRVGRRGHVGVAAPRARARRHGQRRVGPGARVDASSCVVHAEEQTTVIYG